MITVIGPFVSVISSLFRSFSFVHRSIDRNPDFNYYDYRKILLKSKSYHQNIFSVLFSSLSQAVASTFPFYPFLSRTIYLHLLYMPSYLLHLFSLLFSNPFPRFSFTFFLLVLLIMSSLFSSPSVQTISIYSLLFFRVYSLHMNFLFIFIPNFMQTSHIHLKALISATFIFISSFLLIAKHSNPYIT